MRNQRRYTTLIAIAVSLGGFLFGFDASVISGVNEYIIPKFNLSDIQLGWAVSSMTLTTTITMLFAGPISNRFGRRKILLFVGLFYAVSALFSALAPNFTTFILARMMGGFAVGAALVLAPMYIGEISPAEKRGRMVSINQLNIVLGFSASYFCNYYIQHLTGSDATWVKSLMIDSEPWRWMLGIELIPALLFFIAMLFVPESPRWLLMKGKKEEALITLTKINGEEKANEIVTAITQSIDESKSEAKSKLSDLFKPAFRLIMTIALVVGVLQMITGINSIFFYATTIFRQSGIGSDASFSQAIWVGLTNVIFTIIAMVLIDKYGRKLLLLIGTAGLAIGMFITSYGFNQATYTITDKTLSTISTDIDQSKLKDMANTIYTSDVTFKKLLKENLGEDTYRTHQGSIIDASIKMNPMFILFGILLVVASFAISLGPVMWVLFSEIFPNVIRGIAMSFVGFINSMVAFFVVQFFSWEITNFGSSITYLLYGIFALIGFFLIAKLVPETKGLTLEELEKKLYKN